MQRSVIIVDDFYNQVDTVRKLALSSEYPEPDNAHTYPGRNSKDKLFNQKIAKKISDLVGCRVVEAPGSANGRFRISKKSDSFKQDIHIDQQDNFGPDWAGVLFLNNTPTNYSGTCFWKHKKYGFEWCPRNLQEAKPYGFDSYEQIKQEIIYDDGLDRSKWDLTLNVPMRYNRLVLFRPWLWHSHGENFGSTLQDARLVQLFFVNEVKKQTNESDSTFKEKLKQIQEYENNYHKTHKPKLEINKQVPQEPKIVEKYFYMKNNSK